MAHPSVDPRAVSPSLVTAQAPPASRRRSRFPMMRRLFRDKPLGAAGAVICAIFLFCGVFAGWLAPYGVNEINMMARLQPPSWAHLFGTDNLGRDIFSRCLYGAQLSVVIGLSAATLATLVSLVLGILCGYLGGKLDLVVQRMVDAWMSFPDLIILIVVVSVLGPGSWQIVCTLRNRSAPPPAASCGGTSCPTCCRR